MKIAIIIPAYNEELTIKQTIIDLYGELPAAHIYVINNNSTDNTNKLAKETISQLGCKGKVIFEKRQGKANAIRKAFSAVDADIYVMVDADSTYNAKDIHKLIKPILNNEADMVVGDRHSGGFYKEQSKRRFHGFGNNLVINLINFLFRSNLRDIMSGYRVFNRKFVKFFPILSEGFELETEMSLHALHKKFKIVEIPIEYQDRPTGSTSKLGTIKDGFRVIRRILSIFKDYKPLSFFGFFSILFFVCGLVIGLPVLVDFIETRFVSHVPLAILSTGLMIFSLILLSIGIILKTIIQLHRFDYELKLNNYRS